MSLLSTLFDTFQGWFSQPPVVEDLEEPLSDLSPEIAAELRQQIQALPCHPDYQDAVQSALATAVSNWYSDPDAPNSLVILGNPVVPIPPILDQILLNWQPPDLQWVKQLPFPGRSANPLQALADLKRTLEPLELSSPEADLPGDCPREDRQTLVVVPRLSGYFLRCIQGWEGIEYLRDLLLKNPSCFWLIGCNQWTWSYLNYVCQIGAYFEQVQSLPALTADQLKEWLNPIIEALEVELIDQKTDSESSSESYFERLADLSLGLDSVAAQLWLQSLWNPASESEDSEARQDSKPTKIRCDKARLPDLPDLPSPDLYLLFALLLHGEITIPDLALSLGEAEPTVQAQVQVLQRAGIVWQQQQSLRVNPAFYPKLKTKLGNNNFLVEEY